MSRVRVFVLTALLVGVCVAVGAGGASGASFGRCIHLPENVGKYGSAGCQEGQVLHGNYEWYPAFGSYEITKKEFSLAVTETVMVYEKEPAVLGLTCTGGEGEGQFSGNKELDDIHMTLTGCSAAEGECTSAGKGKGEVEASTLDGLVGVWKTEREERHNKVGLQLYPASGAGGTFAEMTCGTSTSRVLSGSIIAMVPPDGPNKMGTEWSLKFMRRGLEQMPEQFEGVEAPPPFKQSLNSLTPVRVSVEATVAQQFKEQLELNTTCTC